MIPLENGFYNSGSINQATNHALGLTQGAI